MSPDLKFFAKKALYKLGLLENQVLKTSKDLKKLKQLKMLTELVKEQVPNEDIGHSTGQTR
jgi:hypothetical protein